MESVKKIFITLVLGAGAALFPSLSWAGSCGSGSSDPKCSCSGTIIIGEGGKSSCGKSFAGKAIDPFSESKDQPLTLSSGQVFNAEWCMHNTCKGKPKPCECRPPDDVTGKPPTSSPATPQTGTVQAPPIPDANQIWATMANTTGNIRIAYQPLGEAGYKECPQIPKSTPIKVYCYPISKTNELHQSEYEVWEDRQSVRFAPVDGDCDLRVAKLDDYGTNEPYTCVDQACEQTKAKYPPLCTGKVGKNGVQVVLGSGGAYQLTYYDKPANVTVGTKKQIVSTSIHPSPTSSGTALMVFNLKPGADPEKQSQMYVTEGSQKGGQVTLQVTAGTSEGKCPKEGDCGGQYVCLGGKCVLKPMKWDCDNQDPLGCM